MIATQLLTLLSITALAACSTGPEGIVKDYLEAPTAQSRFKTICPSPQITSEDFTAYYPDYKTSTVIATESKQLSDVRFEVKVEYKYGPEGERNKYAYETRKQKNGWCVNWVESTRFLVGPKEAYAERKALVGYTIVTISNYYNYDFRKKQYSHYSFQDTSTFINFYAKKDDPAAQKVFEEVKSGGVAIVKLTATPGEDEDIWRVQEIQLVELSE